MIPDIKSIAIAFAIGLVLGALGAGTAAWKYQDAVWTAAVSKQKQEAAQTLAAETEKVRQADHKYDQFKTQVEKENETKRTQVESVLRDNRRLARELGGLRDPGRRTGSQGTVPSTEGTSGQCAGGTSEGRLSDEASEFLLEFAADADRAATYAQTCHAWAIGKDVSEGSLDASTSP